MAIQPRNASDDQGSRNRYTGLTLLKPLCVCPTKAQLAKMGIDVEEEPKYVTVEEKDGKNIPRVRFTFLLHKRIGEGENAEDLLVNHSIFVEAKARYSKDKEKIECIDKYGKSCFVGIEDFRNKNITYDWVDVPSAKAALIGQSELIYFMRTIAAYKKEDEMLLSDMAVGGDVKSFFKMDGSGLNEIRQDVINISKLDNKVKMLLGVRMAEDGKVYQETFNYVGRTFVKTSHFHKELAKLAKSQSKYLDTRDFGPIDLRRDIPNEEDYRLRIYENSEIKKSIDNPEAKEGDNGYPSDWDIGSNDENPLGAGIETNSGGSVDAFDPFG